MVTYEQSFMCTLYGMHSASYLPTPVASNWGSQVPKSHGSLIGNCSPLTATSIKDTTVQSVSLLLPCSKEHTKIGVTSCPIATWCSITIAIILCMYNRQRMRKYTYKPILYSRIHTEAHLPSWNDARRSNSVSVSGYLSHLQKWNKHFLNMVI